MFNKKISILILFLFVAVFIVNILEMHRLVGLHSLLRIPLSWTTEKYCEDFRKIIYYDIDKFKDKGFFKNKFPDNITYYENNKVNFLLPGENINYYINDYGNSVRWIASINSDNFRGREYNLTKNNKTKRIIVVGDSHVFGWGLNDDETFCFNLEENLNATKKKWEVLNMGGQGYNIIQKLQILKMKGLKYKPDIVILQFDQDDIYPQIYREYENELYENITYRLNDLKNITDCKLSDTFKILREEFKKDFGFERLLNSMIIDPLNDLRLIQINNNFSVIVISTWGEPYNEIVKEFSEENNWKFIDVNIDIFNNELYSISKYEPHYNSSAHQMIANYLYNKIIEV